MIDKQAVLDRLNIVAYYEKEVAEIKWNGEGQGKGLCPFHDDHDPSLYINENSGGFYCHVCQKGGDVFSFYEAKHRVDFKRALKELAARTGVSTESPNGQIVATYDYTNESGELIFQAVRCHPKKFFQRRPDGKGGWINDLKGVTAVPYNLTEIIGAEEIILVEGEKDVETLRKTGIVASCNPMGAGKWRAAYNQYFVGKKISVIPDNDDAGRNHAEEVARNLKPIAASVKLVELSGLPEKGDVTNWVEQGGTKEDLLRIIAKTPEWVDTKKDTPPEEEKEYRHDDIGNSNRLLYLHGKDLLYCDRWHVWNEKLWEKDQKLEVWKKAKDVQKMVLEEALKANSYDRREKLLKLAVMVGTNARIKAMIDLARPQVAVKADVWDTDPFLLNCRNGTLDLKTGKLLPHRREDRITKIISADYDPQAKCELWLAFLSRIFGTSSTLIRFVQKALGYSITGDTGEQCLFILYGTGANGKSTFLEIVMKLLNDYAIHSRMETFLIKQFDSIPNDLARLKGSRFVSATEVESGRRLAESLIKSITGKDPLTARFLHHEYFSFIPEFKLWLAVNHRPIIKNTDYAIWRRIRLVPFDVTIPKDEQDPHLADNIIKNQLSGVLNWVVEGCQLWQQEELGLVKDVQEATDVYKKDMDVVASFIGERCVTGPTCKSVFKDLYRAYLEWAEEANEEPLMKRNFGEVLSEKGFPSKYGNGHVAMRVGIGLHAKKVIR